MLRVIGSYLSPFVRKVLVCLEAKGLDYEIDPIVPFFGDERFTALSPLRTVPVLLDGDLALCDSTAICEYLEERQPAPAFYPKDPADRARARWLEELADSRLADLLIWKLFNERAIRPHVWKEPGDEAVVAHVLEVELPGALDFLETQAPERGFCFGEPGIADVAVACMFRNGAFVRYQIDAGRWPRSAGWVERTLALPALRKLAPFEKAMLGAPIPAQREALRAAGAPVSEESLFAESPRPGLRSAP